MAAGAELMSLDPVAVPSRRGFMATSLIAGFTLAAGPVQSQTAIKTPSDGLTEGEVQVPAKGGNIPAYRAMPAAGGPFPTVLVVQEIFGVHEYIKDTCRRLAQIGYLAIAPELYVRQADPKTLTTLDAARAAAGKVPDTQVMEDLDSAVAWAKGNKGNVDKLAITGFCYGGRIVWLYAAHNPKLKAGVAWYGSLAGENNPSRPTHPLQVVDKIKAPTLGLYAEADQGIPMTDVEKMRDALKKAKSKSAIVSYPGAPHGFHADYRASYRADAAEDGWRRLQGWFDTKVASPRTS
jgi:carboxymethylenebutenolidase